MKNVTISLPAEVYRRARIKAAERNSSISALVRDFLVSVGDQADFARRKELQDEVIRSIGRFRAQNRLERGKLHERSSKRKRALR